MYLYETHLHTAPTSACAKAGVRESLEFYKQAGYSGVFMTDHFIDANIDRSLRGLPYEDRIKGYFSAYEEGRVIGEEIGLSVFPAFETSYKGSDFLVYGIDKEWCLAHPDMEQMKKSEQLALFIEEGALVIHAHPFREAKYIDHIRLYPRSVQGVEVYNASRKDFENDMAYHYCKSYGLIPFAGSDNHSGAEKEHFGGVATEFPIQSVEDFIGCVLRGEAIPFIKDENGIRFIGRDAR